MQAYTEYKDSGVDWLGEVPAGWELTKLGSCLSPFSEKNHAELPLLSITRELGVIERDIENQDTNHNYIPDDLSGYKLLKKGQFGMNKMKAWQGSYGVSPFTGIVSPAYFMFDFTREIDPAFFHVVIRSKLYVSFFGSASDGVRIGQWDLSKPRMKEIPLALPPLPEQTAIADFLDDKITKVEALVGIKRRQIELLAERKQILIQNAVTKGLNPDAPMKDSGVDWIGEIPAHWEATKLRYLGTFQNGISAGAEYFGSGYPFVTYGDVYNNSVLPSKPSGLAKSSSADRVNYSVQEGDILFTRTSEVANDIGNSSTCLQTIENASFSGFVIRMRPVAKLLNPAYSSFLFRCAYISDFFAHKMNIVIRASLGQEPLKNLPIFLPSINEQEEIVAYCKSESERMNAAITIKQNQIIKLNEYKTTLINAAVTGKIKVA